MSKRAALPDTTPRIIVETSRSTGKVRQYERGRLLGKGGFARCYCIQDVATGKEYACKVVAKESLKRSRAKQKLLTEIKIHRSLNHDNIVGFYRNFEDETHVYILLELCTKQTLMELVKRRKSLSEDEVRRFGLQIIDATIYLHSQRVIHRDLKLGNLFLTHGADGLPSIRVGDFGLATQLNFDGEKRQTICGTPNYIAPEILNSKTGQGHSYEVDVWSLGCIFYTMLVGHPPFQTRNIKETYRRIRKVTYRFPSNPAVSDAAKYMIQRIFQIDPLQRPTLAQMRQMPFFTGAPFRRPLQTLSGRNQMANIDSQRSLKRKPVTKRAYGENHNHNHNYHYECNPKLLTVVNWIDYTSKYGLGYLMSNGLVGVYFNDSTKMVFRDTDCHNLHYIPRGVSGVISGPKHPQILTLSIDKYPPELKKKVTLMSHFTDHLRKHRDSKGCVVQNSSTTIPKHTMPVYVKRWVKTRHAFLFRLSNKTVQVSFSDKTELVMSSVNDTIFYRGKQGELHGYHAKEAEDFSKHPSVAKRVKHANDIIRMLVSGAPIKA